MEAAEVARVCIIPSEHTKRKKQFARGKKKETQKVETVANK